MPEMYRQTKHRIKMTDKSIQLLLNKKYTPILDRNIKKKKQSNLINQKILKLSIPASRYPRSSATRENNQSKEYQNISNNCKI
ncbi:hypothetical protein WH47_04691 [Habropoda laboriosa]|uniref:Uncharacterized protein n=1 Tax=Habropoda laboriosa TaxID=597456 RepID=A0A0L7R2U8_9HYME|nr:hypothetical protein WH47_04691 [Habropoda laboriosa]